MGQPELDDYHAARRPVARGKLQFHDMGRIERRGHDCLQVLERLPAGGPHALVVAHLVRNGSVICLCPRAYMEPAARLHAVHHGQCDYQMAVCAERLALALFRVGARMGRGCHLRIHHLHAPVLPFGFQSRPGHCQRNGMAHRHGNGEPNGDGMERQRGRYYSGLRQGVCPLRLRHGHTLVAGQLETPLSHLVCAHAVAVDGRSCRTDRFHRLPVRHGGNATVHLFPILRRAASAFPLRPMPCAPGAAPLCDTVKMTIRTRQDSAICTPKRNLLEIYDSRHVGRKRFVTHSGPVLSKSQMKSHGLRLRFNAEQANPGFTQRFDSRIP